MGAGNYVRCQGIGGLLTWRFQQLLHAWLSSLRQEQVQWIGKMSTALPDAEIIGVDLSIEWFKFGCLGLSISRMRCLPSVNCTSNSWVVHPKQTFFQPHSAASRSSRPAVDAWYPADNKVCGRRVHLPMVQDTIVSCRVFSATLSRESAS